MRKRGVVILMAAALTASVPATALADQVAGQIALNGEAASEDVVDEKVRWTWIRQKKQMMKTMKSRRMRVWRRRMRQKQERKNLIQKNRNPKSQRKR